MSIEPDFRHAMQLSLAKELLHSFGELRLAALGSSMIPFIFPGDVVTIRRCNANEIACGDVVLCSRGDRFFVHRVVRKLSDFPSARWITRGDALAEDDPPVRDSELLGSVSLIERDGKKWAPARPTRLARLVRLGVRCSDVLLRLILSWHVHRRLFARSACPLTALHLKRCS